MTTWVYVGLMVLVLAAVPSTVWLKRAGDREWAERQRRAREAELLRPTGEAFLRFQIELVDRMTPALQQVARQMAEVGKVMARAFEQLDAATEQALREREGDA